MDDERNYPTTDDVLAIHEAIVASDRETEAGVRSPKIVESALIYVSEGYFGEVPGTIHEKAAHLMRLLAAEHPFVDGNKRTALNAVSLFYAMNGYEFQYDDSIRRLLRGFATDESAVNTTAVGEYCRRTPNPLEAKHTNPSLPHSQTRAIMAHSTEADYREERALLRERVRNPDSEIERRKAVLRLAEIDREIHADIYAKLARE